MYSSLRFPTSHILCNYVKLDISTMSMYSSFFKFFNFYFIYKDLVLFLHKVDVLDDSVYSESPGLQIATVSLCLHKVGGWYSLESPSFKGPMPTMITSHPKPYPCDLI